MDGANDVDLSNNNITPLWKRRTDCHGARTKPRPLSYQIGGVLVTDFPVEDQGSLKLSQPVEKVAATPVTNSTAVLKHVLNKPSRKARVVRSISIGHLSNARFALSRFMSNEGKSASLDNRVSNRGYETGKTTGKCPQDQQKSNALALNSQRDCSTFGNGSSSPESVAMQTLSSPDLSPLTPNNNSYNHNHNHHRPPSPSPPCPRLPVPSPSPPTCRTPPLSHCSSSSIPSLSSLNSSDPPTPRSPSPADSGSTLSRQASSASAHDARSHARSPSSCSSSVCSSASASSSPSLASPSSTSPVPSIVLSTHSAPALKMGSQQLIPKSLVSDTRQSKAAGGFAGLLGLDSSKRALKTVSMVETGAFFSTGLGSDGDSDSPGTLRRGLRSTSYRRAVVTEEEVPTSKASKPTLKGLQEVADTPASQTSPCSSPSAAKQPSTTDGPAKPASPGSQKPASPGSQKPASPGNGKPSSPGTRKSATLGKNKNHDKKKRLISQRTFDSEEEELYQNYQEKALHNDSDEEAEASRPQPDDRIVVQYRPIRTSWSQLSVVKKSGLADKLSMEDRKRQEAIFEVISSEHSYLHSLEVLIRMFKNSVELSDAMTKTEHHHLFSNITDVCAASKNFFKELEDRHQQNILIESISDIVNEHAQSNFDRYITYCSNEVYQQRTLQRLVSKNPVFKEVLTRIEGHPDCRNLPMFSFLILPMQRITRLPLLMDTICQKTPKDSERYEECKKALQAVSKVVRKCNEGARTMERTEMMYTINSQLEFKIKVRTETPPSMYTGVEGLCLGTHTHTHTLIPPQTFNLEH
ncbi:Rho guanine nucleotide exchange factor 26 [Merluccius polli]|uniref:Rho guanine nucleotide exchange factor 26 n=1 Tax=Merluccius polli TaxID=89951 RepID=A0AA47MRJ2_MERPO|nr:Rho guanine nucleotide exchange factor 26 [Merluccius polli]